MRSGVPAYLPVTLFCITLWTAFACSTILWQIRLERQAQREREGHGPHPAIRRRLRLARVRKIIASRPPARPARAAVRRVRERVRH